MTTPEHFDVVVVGAGISGIGAAHHLGAMSPDRSYVILEGRDDLGGTWDLFRYPGVRSDSDMHTLGYSFKPWKAEMSIADGPAILEYLNETAPSGTRSRPGWILIFSRRYPAPARATARSARSALAASPLPTGLRLLLLSLPPAEVSP